MILTITLKNLFSSGTFPFYWWANGSSERLSDLCKDTQCRCVEVRFLNLILSAFKFRRATLGTQRSGTWTSRNSCQLGIYSQNKHFPEELSTAGQSHDPATFRFRWWDAHLSLRCDAWIELSVCYMCVCVSWVLWGGGLCKPSLMCRVTR